MSNILRVLRRVLFFSGLFSLLLAAHLAHSGVLWEGEVLPLAAALQMKRGAMLYRDIWFDKPPLTAALYLLIAPALRLAGAVWALAACLLADAVSRTLWGEREGYIAAGLFGFFLTFDTHSGVVPIGADLLLLVPHLAAILLALRGRALWSGVLAGLGFLANTKAVLVLAACAVFAWPSIPLLLAGFAIPNLLAFVWLAAGGAFGFYIDQVWRWPAIYAASPVVADPVRNGLLRTVNWLGFHFALVCGAAAFWWRERRWRFAVWTALSFAGVVLGWRFFPRYFFLLLPAFVIMASRGFALLKSRVLVAVAAAAMIVPAVRFGPRYFSLEGWGDLAMDRDSRAASAIIRGAARPGSTLYVWGYRPEIFVYTGLAPATRYLDSQALTGVPADRHLTQATPVRKAGTHEAREELAHANPDILVDGLSLFNPALSMDRYPELRTWLAGYREIGRTEDTVIYERESTH